MGPGAVEHPDRFKPMRQLDGPTSDEQRGQVVAEADDSGHLGAVRFYLVHRLP
jgi:hypothetical protein